MIMIRLSFPGGGSYDDFLEDNGIVGDDDTKESKRNRIDVTSIEDGFTCFSEIVTEG